MSILNIQERLTEKGSDFDSVVEHVIRYPENVRNLIDGALNMKGRNRFACEKLLRLVSEQRPDLVYSYFDVFVSLLDSDNSFIRWGAIITIANLTGVDTENKFDALFARYYAPLSGPAMIAAANIIRSSISIARSRHDLTGRILYEILKVETSVYLHHGKPSLECRNVVCGEAIHAFDVLFNQITDKKSVIDFVRRQQSNTRPSVVKKAEKFLRIHHKKDFSPQ
jgi:hypothetical protein